MNTVCACRVVMGEAASAVWIVALATRTLMTATSGHMVELVVVIVLRAVGPWEDSRAPAFGSLPMTDPYTSGYNASAWAADTRRAASPRVGASFGDPYGRSGHTDHYSRGVPSSEPYGRPAPVDDPYLRSSRRPDDMYGRGRSDPYESYSRGLTESWRDERAPTSASSAFGDSWHEYGYAGSGGGPMRVRDQWRDREDSRGPTAAAPRGRERPGQRYTLKMRGVPFRAIEADIYDFFEPVRPAHVEIIHEASGRPSGEARVEFR
ncbi:hypothetical protein KIN20_004543 [Parelaphostrongylus tenuis]|uniref:RRM domain-containing protein n=1 Tax=Parelaphostrongylus tenuis TaxID=148309 RepID=A0AAD5QEI4_PARTN|nr:hypothetical protein KIN20_004543 [Parelaphostrongylus tenuis]